MQIEASVLTPPPPPPTATGAEAGVDPEAGFAPRLFPATRIARLAPALSFGSRWDAAHPSPSRRSRPRSAVAAASAAGCTDGAHRRKVSIAGARSPRRSAGEAAAWNLRRLSTVCLQDDGPGADEVAECLMAPWDTGGSRAGRGGFRHPHERRMHKLHCRINLESRRPSAAADTQLAEHHAGPRLWLPHERGVALRLLQVFGPSLGALQAVFARFPVGMLSHEFVTEVSAAVRKAEEATGDAATALQPLPAAAAAAAGDGAGRAQRPSPRAARLAELETELVAEWYSLSEERRSTMHNYDYVETDRVLQWSLAMLFCAVDTGGRQSVRWEDLYVYLIDVANKGKEATQRLDVTHRRYVAYPADAPELGVGGIKKAVYSDSLQRMLFLGWDNVCRLVDPAKVSKVIQTYPVVPRAGRLVDMHLMESAVGGYHQSRLATSGSDGTVRIYDLGSTIMQCTESFGLSQTSLQYLSAAGLLLCGGRLGRVTLLSAPDGERRCRPVGHMSYHSSVVTSFLPLSAESLLSTAMEPDILATNVSTMQVTSTFRGHEKGVFSTTHSPEYSLVGSTGYELQPFLWVTNVARLKPFKLKTKNPHTCRIVRIHMVQGTPEMLTLDIRGSLKVWDIRMMHELYTVQCSPEMASRTITITSPERFHDFAYYVKDRRIITSGGLSAGRPGKGRVWQKTHPVYCVQYAPPEVRRERYVTAEDYGVAALTLLPSRGAILTASGNHATLWDAGSGRKVKTLFYCSNLITAQCVVADERVFSGLCDGLVLVHSSDGAELRRIMLHRVSVALLVTVGVHAVVSSEQAGHAAFLLNVLGPPESIAVAQPRKGSCKVDTVAAAFSGGDGRLLLGEPHNVVSVWECGGDGGGGSPGPDSMEHLPLVGECVNYPREAATTAVLALEGERLFVSADSCGGLHLCRKSGGRAVVSWVGHEPEGVGGDATPVARALWHHAARSFLYCADSDGYVCVYDLAPTLRFDAAESEKRTEERLFHSVFCQAKRGHQSDSVQVDTRSRAVTPSPQLICFFKAHREACGVLCGTATGPRCLFTASSDCSIKLWSMWGRLIGVLSKRETSGGTKRGDLPRTTQEALCRRLMHTPGDGAQRLRYPATHGPLAGSLVGLLGEAEEVDAAAPADPAGQKEDASGGYTPYDDVPPPWGDALFDPPYGFSERADMICNLAKRYATDARSSDESRSTGSSGGGGGGGGAESACGDTSSDGSPAGDSPPLPLRRLRPRKKKPLLPAARRLRRPPPPSAPAAAGAEPAQQDRGSSRPLRTAAAAAAAAAAALCVTGVCGARAVAAPPESASERRRKRLSAVVEEQLGLPRYSPADDVSLRDYEEGRRDAMQGSVLPSPSGPVHSFSRPYPAGVDTPSPHALEKKYQAANRTVLPEWLKAAIASESQALRAIPRPVVPSVLASPPVPDAADPGPPSPLPLTPTAAAAAAASAVDHPAVCIGRLRLSSAVRRREGWGIALRAGDVVALAAGLAVLHVAALQVADARRRAAEEKDDLAGRLSYVERPEELRCPQGLPADEPLLLARPRGRHAGPGVASAKLPRRARPC